MVHDISLEELSFPVEILVQILEFYPPPFSSEVREDISNPMYPPLLVSKYWNEVIESSPSLWSTISMDMRHFYDPKIIPRLKIRLGRARLSPLTIHFSMCEDFLLLLHSDSSRRKLDQKIWSTNLKIIGIVSSQWRSLQFWCTTIQEQHTLFDYLKDCRILRQLALGLTFIRERSRNVITQNKAFEVLGSPSPIELDILGFPSYMPKFEVNTFPSLTSANTIRLALRHILFDTESFLMIAKAMPRIEVLTLFGIKFAGYDYFSVQRQEWQFKNSPTGPPLLSNLRKLEILDIQDYRSHCIPRTVMNCGPSMEMLTFTWDPCGPRRDLVENLENCPTTLSSLTVQYLNGDGYFVDHFPRLKRAFQRLFHLRILRLKRNYWTDVRNPNLISQITPNVGLIVMAAKLRGDIVNDKGETICLPDLQIEVDEACRIEYDLAALTMVDKYYVGLTDNTCCKVLIL
jgi:hypothetical protein